MRDTVQLLVPRVNKWKRQPVRCLDVDSESTESPPPRAAKRKITSHYPGLRVDCKPPRAAKRKSTSILDTQASVSPPPRATTRTNDVVFDSESSEESPAPASRKSKSGLLTPVDEMPQVSIRQDRVQRQLFKNPNPVPVEELVVMDSRLKPNPLFISSGKKLGKGLLMSGRRSGLLEDIIFEGPNVVHTRLDNLEP